MHSGDYMVDCGTFATMPFQVDVICARAQIFIVARSQG